MVTTYKWRRTRANLRILTDDMSFRTFVQMARRFRDDNVSLKTNSRSRTVERRQGNSGNFQFTKENTRNGRSPVQIRGHVAMLFGVFLLQNSLVSGETENCLHRSQLEREKSKIRRLVRVTRSETDCQRYFGNF